MRWTATRLDAERLPPNAFGCLVGTLHHSTTTPQDLLGTDNAPDDNHTYLWLQVPKGPYTGLYECAFNTASNRARSRSEFFVYEEAVSTDDFPTPGFWAVSLSYRNLGLVQNDFAAIHSDAFREAIAHWTQDCAMVCAYGVVYTQGDGLHDIHLNTAAGHVAEAEFPDYGEGRDGALVFYYQRPGKEPFRRWVFIKFSTQRL